MSLERARHDPTMYRVIWGHPDADWNIDENTSQFAPPAGGGTRTSSGADSKMEMPVGGVIAAGRVHVGTNDVDDGATSFIVHNRTQGTSATITITAGQTGDFAGDDLGLAFAAGDELEIEVQVPADATSGTQQVDVEWWWLIWRPG